MFRQKISTIMSVFIVLFLSGGTVPSFQRLQSVSTVSVAEAKAVTDTLEQFYKILDTPIEVMDINQFAEVLIDSSEFKRTPEWQGYLSQILDAKTVQSAGYLTAMRAKWTTLQHGNQLVKAAFAKAQANGRDITAEEWQEIAEQNHGMLPPAIYHSESGHDASLSYEVIDVVGDRAVVRYDDGAAFQETILRQVNGRWFIANIEAIRVHF